MTSNAGTTSSIGGKSKHVAGIFEHAVRDIFDHLRRHNQQSSSSPHLLVYMSFFEIYGGRIYDLFNRRQRFTLLENKQGQLHANGMKEVTPRDVQELMQWLEVGERARSTGATVCFLFLLQQLLLLLYYPFL